MDLTTLSNTELIELARLMVIRLRRRSVAAIAAAKALIEEVDALIAGNTEAK